MKYLDLAIANETIKTTDIKGKEYAEVNQRIKAFRMVYPQGTIETEMLSNENGVCIFKASIYIPEYDEEAKAQGITLVNHTRLIGTGTAYEKEDSSFINKTSYIENCETSAVGRALGMCGFGIDVSVASAEEVQNAINNQVVTKEEADNYTLPFGKYKGKKLTEVPEEYIDWLLENNINERILKIIELATGKVLPSEEEQNEKLKLMVEFEDLVKDNDKGRNAIYNHYKVESDKDMSLEQLKEAINKIKEKIGE